tara:strand:- start:546 stop:767 length:222 start_codon:yes stop_codon:yes gene_type:complete
MPKPISGLSLLKFLQRHDFVVYSRKSSHVKMISKKRNAKAIIPLHKTLAPGTLKSILRQARIDSNEINDLFKS